jgi:hypothetical protein
MVNNSTIIIKTTNDLSPTNTRAHTSCNSMYMSHKLQIRNLSFYLINFKLEKYSFKLEKNIVLD